MSKQTGTAVAPAQANPLATVDEHTLALIHEDAQENLNFRKEDLAVPFIRILQSNSPEVLPRNSKYIEGAQAGMFLNTATREVYDGEEGILFVPVSFSRSITQWHPRGEGGGGGLVKDWGTDDTILARTQKNEKNKNVIAGGDDRGDEVVDGVVYYGLVVDGATGAAEQVALTMVSTQLKKARQWNTLITNARETDPNSGTLFRPAMFYYAYQLTTVPESNVHGSWMGFKILRAQRTLELPNGDLVYLGARELRKLADAGEIKTTGLDDGGTMSGEGAAGDGSPDTPF